MIQRIKLGTISIALIAGMALTGCNDSEEPLRGESPSKDRVPLQVTVEALSVELDNSRGIITDNTLPLGSQIGIFLSEQQSASYDTYDDITYNNVLYTSMNQDGQTLWKSDDKVLLSSTLGRIYAYHPHDPANTDIQHIAINTADQKDVMYAQPEGNDNLNNTRFQAELKMKHALTAVRLKLKKGTYTGQGTLSRLVIQSPGLATQGTLNAVTGEVTPTASSVGTPISLPLEDGVELTPAAQELPVYMVIAASPSTPAPITLGITIDGVDYEVKSSDVSFQSGDSFSFNLTMNSVEMSIDKISITPWNEKEGDNDMTVNKPLNP